jgi:hypothetical protein
MEGVAVQSQCEPCNRGTRILRSKRYGSMVHPLLGFEGQEMRGEFIKCRNFDRELRHLGEPMGYYRIAFWPVKCRNGCWRWLTWIEDHGDGTYTLGNRAH